MGLKRWGKNGIGWESGSVRGDVEREVMDKKTYNDSLQSQHWKDVRNQRLLLDGNKCCVCGNEERLNVHHVSYKNLGHENVENDLVTLCKYCHAILHRVRVQTQSEYSNYKRCLNSGETNFLPYRLYDLWKKIGDLLCVEIWLRDKANGGDIDIWDSGMGMVGRLWSISTRIYPDVKYSHELLYDKSLGNFHIKDTLRLARAMQICEMYRSGDSLSKIASTLSMRTPNVQKVLKRHGYNATGKIK